MITMGAMGAYADDGEKRELLPCMKTEAIDTTGAGDAFNGAGGKLNLGVSLFAESFGFSGKL